MLSKVIGQSRQTDRQTQPNALTRSSRRG